jgi:hypothetical protein
MLPNEHRFCRGCLEKQRRIDCLEEQIARLRAKVRYQERTAKEGFFGSSTPSSKIPVKPNSLEERQARRGGGKPGHVGHGRCALQPDEADQTERIRTIDLCPDCGVALRLHRLRRRSIIDCVPVRRIRRVLELEEKVCPRCRRRFQARPVGVLPRALYGNQLLALVAVEHYLDGLTLGYIEQQTGVPYSSLVQALHTLAHLFDGVPDRLLRLYRRAPVKHADETGWRDDGRNGYAWLFCTSTLSIFRFRSTRSGTVARDVFGAGRHAGTLVVDRYAAYNQYRGPIQYCYAHLSRDVEKLPVEFPQNPEIARFTDALVPQLAAAMHLHSQSLSDTQYDRQAAAIKTQIVTLIDARATHPAIQGIQNLFREKAARMYRWAADRRVPADNNRAERELRPLVIARKNSYGSQSSRGAHTREILMTVLHTLKKRQPQVTDAFKAALDHLALNPALDPYDALFATDTT